MSEALDRRPICPGDHAFLQGLFASTREPELALTGWDDAQKEAFVASQFELQRQGYAQQFPQGDFQIVLEGTEPIGRLYLNRGADLIEIVDIAILPPYRNRGLGTGLLREVLEEARRGNQTVRIYVETFNPAQRLYTRLGFQRIDGDGVYHVMEWTPTGPVS